jgi:adenylate cyclase
VKGVNREVRPYVIERVRDETGRSAPVFSEHAAGLDFYLDVKMLDPKTAQRAKALLSDALGALDASAEERG